MSPRKAATAARSAKAKRTPKKSAPMSDQHKAALAVGREQSRVVRSYLDAVDLHKPTRGRKRTSETVAMQLEKVESDLPTASGVARLELLQRRRNLQLELSCLQGEDGINLEELKARFVLAGKSYAERKGIDYQTFREFGVPPAVLKEAGISRKRG